MYFATTVAAAVVVTAAALAYVHYQVFSDARAAARMDTSFAARTAAGQLAQTLGSVRTSVKALAANPGIPQSIAHPGKCTLNYDLGGGKRDRSHLDVIGPDGAVACSSRPAAGGASARPYADAPWLARALRAPQLLAPVRDPATGGWGAIITQPAPPGAVLVFTDLTTLAAHLAQLYNAGRPIVFIITTADSRRVISRSLAPTKWAGVSTAGTAFAPGAPNTFERRGLDGQARLYSSSTVQGVGWHFYAGEPKVAALAPAARLEKRERAIVLAGLLLILLVTWLAYRRIARPLAALGTSVREVTGRPPLQALPPADGPAELQYLATDIDALIASVNRELAERQRAEEQAHQLAALVESSEDAIIGRALDGTITSWNHGAEQIFGYTAAEAIGRNISMLAAEERRDEMQLLFETAASGRAVDHVETERVSKSGEPVLVSLTVSPILGDDGTVTGVSAIARDVGEQRRLEAQLRQTQKMEAIGSLAGGIAHDFNNILMIIRTCVALQLERTTDPDVRGDAEQIDAAAQRAAELTHQLLAFSRQQVLQPELCDMNAVVDESFTLLQRLLGEHIEVVRELEPELSPILVDRSQLTQVVLNLAVNARDAMPGGGMLILRTSNVFFDERFASEHVELEPGAYTLLQVTDTGAGMDAATAARAFDPFFTTKETGTGFGLATVHGIVTQSGGHVWLYSEPGLGTTFKIYFPVAEAVAATRRRSVEVSSLEGAETILYVEDEQEVRTLIAQALRRFGYTVHEAVDADDALRVLERVGEVDLLVTDVVMPGMNGTELARAVLERRPGLRVLFTSGYPTSGLVERGIDVARTGYIEKPYLPDTLALKVRSVLALDS